jgi:diguanylate cyclase (GGDEF)-like protein/PAS domain S-box-containing protein
MHSATPQRRRRGIPLSSAVLVSACLIGLAIMGLDGWRTWQSRAIVVTDDKVELTNLARSLSQHAQDLVQSADTVVVGLREHVEVDGTGTANLDRLRQFMIMQVERLPFIHGLFVYDAAGNWLTNSVVPSPQNINYADRPYFQYHRDHPDRGAHLGPPVRSKADGSWIITLTRRLDTPDGQFGGVVIATIGIDTISDYYRTFDVGRLGTVALTTADGVLITRIPPTPDVTGIDISTGSIFRQMLQRPAAGSFEYKSQIDDIDRLGSYRRSERYGLYSIVAHGMDDILVDWRGDAIRHMEISFCAAAAIWFLGFRFARQIRQRQRMERRYRLLADNSSDAIICIGPEGRKIYVSPAFTTMTGWSVAECLACNWGALVHPDDQPAVLAVQAQFENGLESTTMRFRFLRKDQTPIWVEAGIQHVSDMDGEIAVFVANIRDITKRKAAEDQVHALNLELQLQANTDALTGLGNRRSFDTALDTEWRRARRDGLPISLIMIDVDRFKLFNDRYGHQNGDQCLAAVAGAVMRCSRRPGDFVARYGGEEIVVILPSTPAPGALETANRVRGAIEALQIPHLGNVPGLVVTASLGVATLSPQSFVGADRSLELLESADAALYRAKESGRNRVLVAEPASITL